ncbi:hypothetical protein MBAV_003923 [Candidatus Magnetobacterium bavaricum]|uniref:Uncharacterized protein n=1 Tax=Candidatus Magnetobacterium bavaricum TaxID=29290 RepID=A0A0F3GPJ0_9BACT|nr:hypothetical protein MBAV_003923 [Candidatus Magnetobacterium bavaricum]
MTGRIESSMVLGHEDSTYLSRFCEKVISEYKEPQKLGKKKGEPIGFSTEKYAAAMFRGLTNLQIRIIAERSGISESSMSVWSSLQNYKDAQAQVRNKFYEFIKEELAKDAEGIAKGIEDFYLYNEKMRMLISDMISVGTGHVTLPAFTCTGIGTSITSTESIIIEMNRYKHLLTKGRISKQERANFIEFLNQVEMFIRKGGT